MRWRLGDTDRVEVWRGTELLGSYTGRTLTILVEHQLLAVEVNGWLHAKMTAPRPPTLPRRPAQKAPPRVPFTDAERAANKARRARRK